MFFATNHTSSCFPGPKKKWRLGWGSAGFIGFQNLFFLTHLERWGHGTAKMCQHLAIDRIGKIMPSGHTWQRHFQGKNDENEKRTCHISTISFSAGQTQKPLDLDRDVYWYILYFISGHCLLQGVRFRLSSNYRFQVLFLSANLRLTIRLRKWNQSPAAMRRLRLSK